VFFFVFYSVCDCKIINKHNLMGFFGVVRDYLDGICKAL